MKLSEIIKQTDQKLTAIIDKIAHFSKAPDISSLEKGTNIKLSFKDNVYEISYDYKNKSYECYVVIDKDQNIVSIDIEELVNNFRR